MLRPGGRLGDPRDHDAARLRSRRSTGSGSTASCRCSASVLPGGDAYTYLPASVRRFPGPEELAALLARVRLRGREVPALRRGDRRPARGRGAFVTTSLSDIREAPGLEAYLDALEERLARSGREPSRARRRRRERGARRRREAAAAAARLPLRRRRDRSRRSRPASRSSSCTWRRSSTTTSSTARTSAAARPPPGRCYGPEAARATGDYLFARAFAELSRDRRRGRRSQILADATLCLARGEALQRTQTHDPSTTVEAYLERCALKTGKLFEAACRLGGGSGEYGLALGVAFQIADDVLDCSGATIETGKIAGTDLRDGTPTLPLLLAAQRGRARARRARGRPARRRARAGCRDRRARRVPGGGARLR